MYPVVFEVPQGVPIFGGQPITSYGVMLLLAFAVAGVVLRVEMRRGGIDADNVWDILVAGIVGGLVGGRGLDMALHHSRTVADPVGMLLDGGMVWYGGVILGTTLIAWRAHSLRTDLGRVFDAIAPAVALGYGVGRVGCFLVGDDYGRPTDSWVGVRFPRGRPPSHVEIMEERFGITVDPEMIARHGEVLPVHPTQLYETALSTAIFFLLWTLRRHRHEKGWLFMTWLVWAGTARFAVEIFRAKDDRVLGPLSVSQLLSLAFVGVGVVCVRKLRKPQ